MERQPSDAEAAIDVGQSQGISSGRVLGIVSLATILALSIWFSINAIGPALEREKGLSTSDLAWLTIAIQIGFVAGTLVSAYLNLADRIRPRA
ncbi:MAG: hypothetical protein ACE10G_09280, partial [Gemmatimonadales bacterium]